VVDAILGAPAVLSGIPANLHANMQNMAKRKFSAAQEQAEACVKNGKLLMAGYGPSQKPPRLTYGSAY
jgi:hypothetical protein